MQQPLDLKLMIETTNVHRQDDGQLREDLSISFFECISMLERKGVLLQDGSFTAFRNVKKLGLEERRN